MSKSIARGLFYLLAAALFMWTSTLTYRFTAATLPGAHWALPVLSVFVFDAGALIWLAVYLGHGEGITQRTTALVMSVFDLAGIALMAAAELWTGGQSLAAAPERLAEAAIWGVTIWTVTNAGAVVLFHLASPGARLAASVQAEKDAIFSESLERLKGKRAAVSGRVSDAMADHMLAQLLADLQQGEPGNQQRQAARELVIMDPSTGDRPKEATTARPTSTPNGRGV